MKEAIEYGQYMREMMHKLTNLDADLFSKYKKFWHKDLVEQEKTKTVTVLLLNMIIDHVLVPIGLGENPTLTK